MSVLRRRPNRALNPITWELDRSWRVATLRVTSGRKIRYAWSSAGEQPTNWIVFVNGRNEYIEKYGYLPQHLGAGPSWGFLTWDHAGQGDSSGQRGHGDFATFAADAGLVVRHVVGPRPYVVVGHSMGALIALRAMVAGQFSAARLVLISPFLGVPPGLIPPFVAAQVAAVLQRLGLGRAYVNISGRMPHREFHSNDKTSNRERYLQQALSPYPPRQVTFGWLHSAFAALDLVHDRTLLQRRLRSVQVLVLQGSEESVVDTAAITQWLAACRVTGVDAIRHIVGPAKHELLSESPSVYANVLLLLRDFLTLDQGALTPPRPALNLR